MSICLIFDTHMLSKLHNIIKIKSNTNNNEIIILLSENNEQFKSKTKADNIQIQLFEILNTNQINITNSITLLII